MNARLIKIDHPADRTIGFVIELDQPFEFRAGQSCELTLVNPPYQDGKGSTRTFSITSAPTESPRLMFATRQTGSAFKRSLEEAPRGLAIDVDGPWGTFVLHDDRDAAGGAAGGRDRDHAVPQHDQGRRRTPPGARDHAAVLEPHGAKRGVLF